MKKIIIASLILATNSTQALDITLSKSIDSNLRSMIDKDLNLVENFKFKPDASEQTLKVMEMSILNGETATAWLNKRVKYIVSEKALSPFNLLVKKIIFVEQKNVDFPNEDLIPYSMDKSALKNLVEIERSFNEENGFTVMSNIGAALYYGGKKEKQVYGMKISRGFLKKAEKAIATSARVGIIQIGEGLFAPELTVNKINPNSLANSIFRLGTFFHEARHSDGNGASLGFMHTPCPAGHDYAGQPACDENLNGPYTVGTLMIAEMSKACDESCSEKDKETLKILILDSANRVLSVTHKSETSTIWDTTPESL